MLAQLHKKMFGWLHLDKPSEHKTIELFAYDIKGSFLMKNPVRECPDLVYLQVYLDPRSQQKEQNPTSLSYTHSQLHPLSPGNNALGRE